MNLRDKLKFWIALNNYIEMIVGPAVAPLSLDKAVADSLSYVKAYGGTEQRNLPSEYTQVEYLESVGGQYIDTGIKIKATQAIKQVMTFSDSATTGWTGAIDAATNLLRFGVTNGLLYCQRPTTGGVSISADDNFHTFLATPTSISIDNTSQTTSNVSDMDVNFCIFAQNDARSGSITSYVAGKVKAFEITENGTIVQNLIPARRKSDNVLGMYDTVSGQFFTNAGSGNFTAGADVVPTSDAPMDIVCNNGVLKLNTSATGYSTQTGTPTPINPIDIVSYKQGDLILRGIGDYKDAYDATTGTITRNVGVKVLDGTEFWNYYSVTQGVLFRVQIADAVSGAKETLGVLCNAYQVVPGGNRGDGTLSGSATNYDFINDNYTTDTSWKAYLAAQYAAGTPVIIYYPLVTPTTEHYVGAYADGLVETIEDTIGNTATCENLLSIGDYTDTQEILSGDITRKVGVKVLDGTENWTIAPATYADGTRRIYTNDFGFDELVSGISSHFVDAPLADRDSPTGQQGKMYHSATSFHLRATQFTSLPVAKQWLAAQYNAGTPVIIVYPLATETTESVAGQTLQVQAGNNILDITQASISGLNLEAKYKKVP